jgi:aryl-alcohol dehydrogenase-like predicted oxidoreductase
MKTKKLGYSDLEITAIGFGTWAIGGGGWDYSWGKQDDDESIKTIHKAINSGINWIDTAPVYGLGHSEEVVGKAIKGMSEKPYIATKCARVWTKNQELGFDLSRNGIRTEVEQSLKRLQIEVIDLLQIHWNKPEKDIEEGWSAIAELIKEGKVRYGGVSNFTVKQLERIQAIHPVASLQPPYSMLVRNVEEELLPFCRKHNIGVVCYSPMYKGLLSGKFSKERMENLDPEDHRKRDPKFSSPEFDINLELVAGLEKIAKDAGYTVAQLAIAWTLRRPEVTAAIVGGRKSQQVEEVVAAGDWELSATEIDKVEDLLKKRAFKTASL